jgi:hypothetical protein
MDSEPMSRHERIRLAAPVHVASERAQGSRHRMGCIGMTIARVIFAAACAIILIRAIMLAPPPPRQPMPAFMQAGPVYPHDDGARD